MKASESPYNQISVIPSGLPNIDRLTGIGGIPRRRITEISGPYSVGKTTLMLLIAHQAQEMGLRCVWADIEWSWDELYAKTLGVATNELGLIQEQYAEASLDLLEEALTNKDYDVAFIDSIGGLLPRAEAEKGAEGKVIGGQASLVAKFCRKIVPILAINNQALVVSNHQFTDIMSGRLKTSGGAKLEYHKSLQISLRRVSKRVMQGDKQIGVVIEAKIRKNKLAATQEQEAEVNLLFGRGFSQMADLLQEAIDKEIITKEGQKYMFRGESLGRGINAAREKLESSEALQEQIHEDLRKIT